MQNIIPYVFLNPQLIHYHDLCDLGEEETALAIIKNIKKSSSYLWELSNRTIV